MTVLEIVQAKLRHADIATFDMEIAIGEVEQVIKSYCNLETVPEELYYTWANMAIDLVSYTYHANACAESVVATGAGGSSFDPTDVSSIKIGDTQVSLGGGSSKTNARAKALASHKPVLDDITMNYHGQLNQFRRLVW